MKKLVTLAISLTMVMALTVPCFAASPNEYRALALTAQTAPTQSHSEEEHLPSNQHPPKPGMNNDGQKLPDVQDPIKPEPTRPMPIPAPTPKARFLTESIVLNDRGDEVTEVVIGETYSLETTIYARLTGEEVVSLDAQNLRVRLNDYFILHGFRAELFSGLVAPVFVVYDKDSDVSSGYNLIQVAIADTDRAITSYVKGSAELLTRDGKTIALKDTEFLTREGALIGDSAADGVLLAEETCTVRLKFTVEEDEFLPVVNDSNGNPLPGKTLSQTPVIDQTTDATASSDEMQKSPMEQKAEVSPAPYENGLYSKEYFDEQHIKFIEARLADAEGAIKCLFGLSGALILVCFVLIGSLVVLSSKVSTLSNYIDEMEKDTFEPQEQDGEHQEHPQHYGDSFEEEPSGEEQDESDVKLPEEEIDRLNKVQNEVLGSAADDSDK